MPAVKTHEVATRLQTIAQLTPDDWTALLENAHYALQELLPHENSAETMVKMQFNLRRMLDLNFQPRPGWMWQEARRQVQEALQLAIRLAPES